MSKKILLTHIFFKDISLQKLEGAIVPPHSLILVQTRGVPGFITGLFYAWPLHAQAPMLRQQGNSE